MTAMPKPKFSDGERVLCFHGPLIYEAKALKNSLTKDKQVKYLIHYLGWNKNWDEWVLEDRVLKYNDANVQKQKEVSKQHASTSAKNKKGASANIATQKIKKPKSTSARGSKIKKTDGEETKSRTVTPNLDVDEQTQIEDSPSTSVSAMSTTLPSNELKRSASMAQHDLEYHDEAKKIKRRQSSVHPTHDNDIEPQSQTLDEQKLQLSQIKPPKLEVKLIIPEELKRWLIDDSDAVNRQQKLHVIPAEKTVQEICAEYKEYKDQKDQSEIIDRITAGLIEYFDVLLGGQLLYKFERHQYADILDQYPGEPMSKLYGSFHLLRLFVRLGTLLTYNSLDEATLSSMMEHVHDFLNYLVENSGTLFSMQHFVNMHTRSKTRSESYLKQYFSLPDNEEVSENECDEDAALELEQINDAIDEHGVDYDCSDTTEKKHYISMVEDSDTDSECHDIDDDWSSNTHELDVLEHCFDETACVTGAQGDREIDYFQMIFNSKIQDKIVEETNRYASQKESKNWIDLNVEELRAFLGCLVTMGIHKLPHLKCYWSSDHRLRVDSIAEVMTANRYKKIVENLHLNNNEKVLPKSDVNHDKLFKVRPLMDFLNENIRKAYQTSSFFAIDESMIAFKGRSSLKQFMPMKPVKRGYKVWCLADSTTGYVFAFDLYTGKESQKSSNTLGERVVISLAEYVRQHSLIVVDNFFTSYHLLQNLLEKNIYACGTVRSTSKGLPDFMRKCKNKTPKNTKKCDKKTVKKDKTLAGKVVKKYNASTRKTVKSNRVKKNKTLQKKVVKVESLQTQSKINMKRGEFQFLAKKKVAAVQWMDSKPVNFLSSAHSPRITSCVARRLKNGTSITVGCPAVVAAYNKSMGGVDLFDQLHERYKIGRRSLKWWHRIFYWLVDMAIVNSFAMWKLNQTNPKKCNQLTYRLNLSSQLISGFTSRKNPGRPPNFFKCKTPVEVRLANVGRHMPIKNANPRRCKLCSSNKKEKRTKFTCTFCKVPLCAAPCFAKFHK